MKKDKSGFVMKCETTCGYCRKEVKLAHGIEAVYMYFNESSIWGRETMVAQQGPGSGGLSLGSHGIGLRLRPRWRMSPLADSRNPDIN